MSTKAFGKGKSAFVRATNSPLFRGNPKARVVTENGRWYVEVSA